MKINGMEIQDETTYYIKVDQENNSESWWHVIHRYPNLYAALADETVYGVYDEIAVSGKLLKFLVGLPGWNDPDAPEFAPNPLMVSDERITERDPDPEEPDAGGVLDLTDRPLEWWLQHEPETETANHVEPATEDGCEKM